MKLLVAVMALALNGAVMSIDAVETAEPPELSDVRISIGRLGVINEHTRVIWQKMRSDEPRSGYEDPAAMNSSLRRTVWEFNELRDGLCLDRFLVEQSCGPPYVPKWVYESQKAVPSSQELQARQEELEGQVVSLWDAACERLKKIIPDEDSLQYCSVE